jgi:branched-chain amino acid transport system permease protein
MSIWISHILNGLSLGMVLFLLASGLTLIFGLMNIANLAHGGIYLVGAYVGFVVIQQTGHFLLGVIAGGIAGWVVGLFLERFFLKRIMGQDLAQVLLTIGFALIFGDLYLWLGKGFQVLIPKPKLLAGYLEFSGITFPKYRLFIIIFGVFAAICLWLLYEKTRLGAMIRAGADDEQMAKGVGLNIPLIFTAVFASGACLTAVGGVLGGPILGIYPGVDWEVLLMSVAVIIIGGLGNLKGAFFAGLLVGLLDNFGKAFFPELAYFTIFAPMVIILLVRPQGLLGGR